MKVYIDGMEIVTEEDEDMVIRNLGAEFYNTISYNKQVLQESKAEKIMYLCEGRVVKIIK